MTDREMLELAAKAAGQERSAAGDLWSNARGQLWDPLGDDGDALRLFAALPGCRLELSEIGVTVFLPHAPGTVGLKCTEYGSEHRNNLGFAIRRAITRAAAEIGKQMGGGDVG